MLVFFAVWWSGSGNIMSHQNNTDNTSALLISTSCCIGLVTAGEESFALHLPPSRLCFHSSIPRFYFISTVRIFDFADVISSITNSRYPPFIPSSHPSFPLLDEIPLGQLSTSSFVWGHINQCNSLFSITVFIITFIIMHKFHFHVSFTCLIFMFHFRVSHSDSCLIFMFNFHIHLLTYSETQDSSPETQRA